MTRYSLWLAPLVCGVVLLLTGALDRKPAPVLPPPVTDLGPLPDGRDALQLLAAAGAAYNPQRVPWQRIDLWQRVRTDGGHHEVRGRYLTAPGCRLRLELEVQVGKTRAAVQLVSDGQRLWQRQGIGGDEPTVTQAGAAHAAEGSPRPRRLPGAARALPARAEFRRLDVTAAAARRRPGLAGQAGEMGRGGSAAPECDLAGG